jgi:hypothetical protein
MLALWLIFSSISRVLREVVHWDGGMLPSIGLPANADAAFTGVGRAQLIVELSALLLGRTAWDSREAVRRLGIPHL